jgi:triosephosphate isomerase (TIM)
MMSLIIANWKSHKTKEAAELWLEEFGPTWSSVHNGTEVAIAPPFPLLPDVAEKIRSKGWPLALAVQDMSPFPPGKYTGAVATESLAAWPVKYAIVGHSERRQYFHETHQDVANKVVQALAANITPVVCVDDEYARQQAAALSPSDLSHCILAYEPLEAIGSGDPQPAEEVATVVQNIRKSWEDVPIIYGGSVDPENVKEYLSVCQGVLVGTHSLVASDFAALVKSSYA